jgi:dTMP kinase
MKHGLFITFEGADGCGKTTQIKLFTEYLQKNGYEVVLTREPGSKGLGENIRKILLDYDGEVSPVCESFLFLADRAQNVDIIVKKNIEKGKIVISDRHIDSTVAYQGYGRKLDLEQIKELNNIATSGLKPDLTFVFDIDIETSMQRVGKTKDRMEASGKEFFERVQNGYLEIAKNEPNRVKVINANDTVENINKQVISLFEDLIN